MKTFSDFKKSFLFLFLFLPGIFISFSAQAKKKDKKEKTIQIDTSLYSNLKYRNIGPFRGGRSAAVTGVNNAPRTFYMGSTGGGVWKTTDGGNTWNNISDGYFGGTIGAVTVSQSDPNIIYAAGGEVTVRGNVSHGYGIWKSLDAGETWKYMGLKKGQYIPRIRIHPQNPELVYAAVLGHIFGPNPERGIYRSKDGGQNWEKVLYVSPDAGACDLILDPSNSRVIYASTWKVRRTPYSLESGGEGSALWKSTDGGDHWVKLNDKPGFPKGTIGIIGVTVSRVNPKRIWAIIEADKGGLFRSEDAGMTWKRINSDRNLRQRAWYYSRIYADPSNDDMIYVLNVGMHVSKDGGKTFQRIRTPHGDHHDLWISENDPNVLIVGDDGGAQISIDAGKSWSTYYNQPTAQVYRLSVDDHFPYRIYGGQQDNSAFRISGRSFSRGGITEDQMERTAGGESGYIVPDPKDPEIVFGGSYGGYLEMYDHRTKVSRMIDVWPDNPLGWGAKDLKYRFQWNFPIFFSKFSPNTLYCAANVLFKSTNYGQSWEKISPDLTRHDTSTLLASGGPITKDNTGVEVYATIFAIAESKLEEGVFWAGSDDGLLHITKDGGKNWENITPPSSLMPEWTMINSIEPGPYGKGTAYVASTGYKRNDFTPYLLKTDDYGKTWTLITKGIDKNHFTRVVRTDPEREGLLYAGTEAGMYISYNDGQNWQPFQLNLPVVPVTDIAIHNQDLIVATQGRSIWILDDLNMIHSLSPELAEKDFFLVKPRDAYRVFGGKGGKGTGENPPNGAVFNFYLKDTGKVVRLDILETDGEIIKSFRTGINKKDIRQESPLGLLKVQKGINRFAWNLQYPGVKVFDGLIIWAAKTSGPVAVPGEYLARLVVGDDSTEVKFTVLKNPATSASQEDLQEQFDFLIQCRDKLTETHQAILDIRKIRKQIKQLQDNLDKKKDKDIFALTEEILKKSSGVEKALYQTRNKSPQDPLNFPIRLNNKLGVVASQVSSGDFRPTDQAWEVKKVLTNQIDEELKKFEQIKNTDIPKLNKIVLDKKIEIIQF